MRDHADADTHTASLRPDAAGRDEKIAWTGAGTLPRSPKMKIDRYEVREIIGCGGMGTVYRAVDTKLGRTVALKTAASKRAGARLTDRVRQRFLREAMALSKVEHRNVAHDVAVSDDP